MNHEAAPLGAIRENKPAWQRSGVPGLYRRSNGNFYSRYCINGRRTWRSLDTDQFEAAKLRHERRRGDVETARQVGTAINCDLRTLGALARELEREINAASVSTTTKAGYQRWLARLTLNWPGDFETTLARSITRDTIVQLRNQLATRALVGRGGRERRAFRPSVVNQTLTILRMILDLAVRHHAIASNPFAETRLLGRSIYLPHEHRRPQLPNADMMERLLAEVARVPDSLGDEGNPEYRRFREARAVEVSDACRFLAYSGLRLGEARASRIEDDHGDTLIVRGSKTPAAARVVPVNPALRTVLDRIRSRRSSGPMLGIRSPRVALARACSRLGIATLRPHDLRHYFATACIESGVPIPTVADWLGHADGGTVLMRTYRHLRSQHSLEAARRVQLVPAEP